MRYFGGKTRTCKQIEKIINKNIKDGQTFISLFVGGGWIEQYIKADKKILCDAHLYLIEMYKGLKDGYKLPTQITKEEYLYIKEHLDEDRVLSGFVGFGCSHSGKFFRGYAKDSTGRNYCLNAKNSMKNKIDNGLLEADFYCSDYREWLDVEGTVIYCDPPYNNTEPLDYKVKYNGSRLDKFDTQEFWENMRKLSQKNIVFISEYEAPCDFKVVWEQDVSLDMRNKDGGKSQRTERLYVHQSRENDFVS